MYMAYGWPHIIPMESGQCSSSEEIIYLKVINRLLLVVCSTHLELWSSHQHRVRLGKYTRDLQSVEREGLNLRAVWSPDAKLIAIITSSFFLHIFKVNITNKRLQIGGKQGPFLASISTILSEEVPFANKCLSLSNIICDNKYLLLGLSDGSLFSISWKGEFIGAFDISVPDKDVATICRTTSIQNGPNDRALGYFSSAFKCSQGTSIIQLEFSLQLKLLFVLYSNGDLILCSTNQKSLKLEEADSIKAERKISSGDVVCASFSTERQILAVGTRRGMVELYGLAECGSLIRTVSLHDWGYSADDTGPVNCIAWTADNSAFSVGWKFRGLTVWSISGCRLMSTICQIGLPTSPADKPSQYIKHEPLVGGTSMIQWDEYGYKLYAVEEGTSARILIFSFGKCCVNKNIFGSTNARQLLYGEDRLLIVQSEDSDKVKILHLNLPVTYLSQNWPVLHVSANKDGMYIAVAGLRGILIYGIRLKKWRFFGDITQEQKIQCKGLLWLGKIIIICNYNESSDLYELLFYPRYHLDKSSLLCRKPLPAKPIVMDVYEDYILIAFPRFNVHVFRATIHGNLSPLNNPRLQLCTVRELSILTAKSHPAAMIFVPDQLPRDVMQNNVASTPHFSSREPTRCLILRSNGELTLLDLVDGHERDITESVELFWVTCGQLDEKTNLIEEISWLDYGCEGMRVWYPSPGADPFKQEDFLQLDPELEFDREVYPLGLLPHAGVVVGVSQRMSFATCTEFPCFEPFAQVQTILHCLLRHLLQRNKNEEALKLARLSAEKPHFMHCLEWLLFTVFDSEISRQNYKKNQLSMSKDDSNSLLEKTCDLIRNFDQYHDVVVSVARKTDGRHWADLFSTAGRSTELFEECILRRWHRTAACYILVIAKLEGVAVSQYCALKLLQATLDESLYELAGELVRFLLRSGKDYDSISTDSDRNSPKFLGYFFFGSNHGSSSSDFKRASLNEKNAHVASVMNILESHASYLMSEKELSKLVSFVKGTRFDLVDYLQREKFGSARLDSFSSGLKLIQKKLEMDTLQSRMDAEFLLAHVCSVKFKEWIVVLATLLRRSEVLFHLFQGDSRLWTAYKATLLESHSEYGDLLDELEGRLSSSLPLIEDGDG